MAEKGSKVDELRAMREARYAARSAPKPKVTETIVESAPATKKRRSTKKKETS